MEEIQQQTVKLTGKQTRFLRGKGHHLKPVVQIGKSGLGESLMAQIEECLLSHELIKVKILETCPDDRKVCASAIVQATGAVLAQNIGRTLLLYRPHPEEPVLNLP